MAGSEDSSVTEEGEVLGYRRGVGGGVPGSGAFGHHRLHGQV